MSARPYKILYELPEIGAKGDIRVTIEVAYTAQDALFQFERNTIRDLKGGYALVHLGPALHQEEVERIKREAQFGKED